MPGQGKENIEFVANNAGMGVYGLLETDLDRELDLIDLNVTAVHILSKLFLRDMVKNGRGILMNVGSCAGFMSGPTFSVNYASKKLRGPSDRGHPRGAAPGEEPRPICLCPGPTDTAFNKNSGVTVSGNRSESHKWRKEGVDGALQGKMIVIPRQKDARGRQSLQPHEENTSPPESTSPAGQKAGKDKEHWLGHNE